MTIFPIDLPKFFSLNCRRKYFAPTEVNIGDVVNLIGGTIFGFPALFKTLSQYGIYGDQNNCSSSSLINRTEIEIRELSCENALTLEIILFEIPSVIIGPLIDRFGCRFVKLITI
ncbi:unnamed protein product [Rotaria sordida]|uniref:Uncharacterized protein n=1 Tax=Rotaria sordida TaxID=392033 RepID=A0A815B748_9BILA|nr:unnamed protein product [Rotaria sordida]CAF1265228.1 unnamed protein product [Rotaria sordida]